MIEDYVLIYMATIRSVSVRKREENKIYLAGVADDFAPGHNYCFYYSYEKGTLETIGKRAFVKLSDAPKEEYRKFDFEKNDLWVPDEGDGTYALVIYTVGQLCNDRQFVESKYPFVVSKVKKKVAAKLPVLSINYPATGRKTLPIGTTTITIRSGEVTLPDGTTEKIYSARAVKSCRSLLIYMDQPIDIILTWKGSPILISTVFPEWTRMAKLPEFEEIDIETTQETALYITMSEDPDGVPEYTPDQRLTPATQLGYNAADDLVSIKKIISGMEYRRDIDDPDVADKTVDRWVEYGKWSIV